MKNIFTLCLGVITFAVSTHITAASALGSDKKDFSYVIGYKIGAGMQRDGLDVDTTTMSQGISDALKGTTPKIPPAEMQKVMQRQQQKQVQSHLASAQQNKIKGEKYLAANKTKKGVVTLASGLQYKILKQGKGSKPRADNTVVAHYRGTLLNGKEFDSSYKRGKPANFQVGGVIKGWQEILQLMPVGSKYQAFIPSSLGYGERGAGSSIGPNETLIFDIELLDIK